jgi:hypothetical protein
VLCLAILAWAITQLIPPGQAFVGYVRTHASAKRRVARRSTRPRPEDLKAPSNSSPETDRHQRKIDLS